MTPKFPKIYHLPWSPGISRDDKVLNDSSCLLNKELEVTEKMDGSNVCLTRQDLYARSHSKIPTHPSFDYLKDFYHKRLRERIPEGFSCFFEYCYAIHSIKYTRLPSYLFLASVRDDINKMWLSCSDIDKFAYDLKVLSVPYIMTISRTVNEETLLDTLRVAERIRSSFGLEKEGYVIRNTQSFPDDRFEENIAKYVRKGHVKTDKHWSEKWEKQKLLK